MGVSIDDLIISLEVEKQQAQRKHERSVAEIKTILATAKAEGRANLSAEEDDLVDHAERNAKDAKVEMAGVDHKLEVAKRTKAAEFSTDVALADRRRVEPGTTTGSDGGQARAYDQVARVKSEERTYHRGNTYDGGPFLQDVVRQTLFRDVEAEQRLSRHMREERVERGKYLERAAGTGAFAGLTVPQYLTEMYAPATATCARSRTPATSTTCPSPA
jgi:hypothetical protein